MIHDVNEWRAVMSRPRTFLFLFSHDVRIGFGCQKMARSIVGRLAIALVPMFIVGCGQEGSPPVAVAPLASSAEPDGKPARIDKVPTKYLPNVVRVHEKVMSGGLPEGDEAFDELKSMGVKTIISVDGAKPDLAAAEKFGLRYVHLPHGYDGIPEERAAELAKAVRELPGQIYIHCHHGMHRSPAASAVACVSAGLISKEAGMTVLKVGGTSDHYRGLFESANSAHPLDVALLDALHAEFPPIAKLPAMAEAMVEIEHVHDHLKALEQANWKILPQKPDLIPAHEALLLREHFTELLRTDEVKSRPAQFQQLLKAGEASAQELEDALRAAPSSATSPMPAAVRYAFKKVSDNCKACHEQFRDVPLSEKENLAALPTH